MNVGISVVIPVYNRKEYIIDAIESVGNQTYQPLEIIVVDDGSSDGTVAVVEAYCQKSGMNITISRNKRAQGVSGARNTGVELSKGDYIAFLDSDDVWLPEHLKRLNDCLVNTGAQIVSEGFDFFGIKEISEVNDVQFKLSKDSILMKGFEQIGEKQYLSGNCLFQTALSDGIFFRIQASLIDKKVFQDHNIWFDETIVFLEDHQILLECAYKRLSFAFVDEIGVMVRKYRDDSHYNMLGSQEARRAKMLRTFDRRIMNAREREEFYKVLYEMGLYIMKVRSFKKNVLRRTIESSEFLYQFPNNRGLREAVKNIIPLELSRYLVRCWRNFSSKSPKLG